MVPVHSLQSLVKTPISTKGCLSTWVDSWKPSMGTPEYLGIQVIQHLTRCHRCHRCAPCLCGRECNVSMISPLHCSLHSPLIYLRIVQPNRQSTDPVASPVERIVAIDGSFSPSEIFRNGVNFRIPEMLDPYRLSMSKLWLSCS